MKEQRTIVTEEMAFKQGVEIETLIKQTKARGYVVINDHVNAAVGRKVEFELSVYITQEEVLESTIMLSRKMVTCGDSDLLLEIMRLNNDYLSLMEIYLGINTKSEEVKANVVHRFCYHYKKVIMQIPGLPTLNMPFDLRAAVVI